MIRTWLVAAALVLAAGLVAVPPTATAQPVAVPTSERTTTHPAAWHRKHFHMNAYRRTGSASHLSGRCNGSWHDDSGECWGYGEQMGDFHGHGYPFQNYLHWEWNRHPTNCPHVPGGRDPAVWQQEVLLESSHQGTGQGSSLCGWVDHGWHTMIVTGGAIVDRHGIARPVDPTGGRIGDREQQGGPLFVHLSSADQGYVFGLRGYLHY